jgi:2-oxoisovalerate dehydrogenase E2 component (dihydrolipoyl transacylase)
MPEEKALEKTFALPDLGEGLTEAEIVAWHVGEGDHVVTDQPLVSVETDKAVVEIPSPWSGRVARLVVALHARVPVGAPLVVFGEASAADTGTVVGSLTPAVAVSGPGPATTPVPARPARVKASPAVRALAASHRLDLASVTGSGPDGEITRADVEIAAVGEADRRVAEGTASGMLPVTGVRRAMALRMAEAGASVVPATLTDEADVTAWTADAPIMARLVLALAAGCAAEPALNAAFDGKAMTRRLNAAVHAGIAVDSPDGLFVPVLRDVHQANAETITARLAVLVQAVAARTIAPDAMRGATIALSNFGALGGMFASLVVVPPQVAILGAGRIRTVPGLSGTARRILPLSLTFDHRAVSGGEAARFLSAVIAHLQTV